MSANGPVMVSTPDRVFTTVDSTGFALSSVSGIGYDEQRAVAKIEALVNIHADASATDATVSLVRGPALTGAILQDFPADKTAIAAAQDTQVVVSFLDSQPPGADVQYSLTVTVGGAAGPSTVTVYGFTVITFPGGVTVLASND